MRQRYRRSANLVALALVAGLAPAPPAAAEREIKTVLIIHGGPEVFPGNATFDLALRRALNSDPAIQVDAHSEYFENEEFGEAADVSLREYLRLKYADRRPDVVIANAAPALEFVLRHRGALFPDAPLVFISAAPSRELIEGRIPGVTGVVRHVSQAETVKLALDIHPETRRLHVVAYAPAVVGFQERVRSAVAAFASRVTITFSNEPSLPEMLAALRTLPADSLIFWVRYSPVTDGRVIFPDAFLPEIVAAAPVPIYSSLDRNLGNGVVGGMMRNNVADATTLAGMALRVLSGAVPQRIPVAESEGRPVFDWRQLRRWKIAESQLPANADIQFRVPTIWQLYGGYIFATTVVVLAQLVLIGGLLRQRARLRHADNTIRAREASLRSSYDRIRNVTGRLINAQEAARANVARELHDDVSEKLMFVALGISALKKVDSDLQDPKAQRLLAEISRDTQNTFESIRRLSHDLHSATLHLLGLVPALQSHCKEVEKRQAVTVQFSSTDATGTKDPDVALCFFRIAQESMRNAIVHGGATRLIVTLGRSGERLELSVADDGRGFDVSAARRSGGLGLVTMEERANAIGGEVTIVSSIGHGATVRVGAPVLALPFQQSG